MPSCWAHPEMEVSCIHSFSDLQNPDCLAPNYKCNNVSRGFWYRFWWSRCSFRSAALSTFVVNWESSSLPKTRCYDWSGCCLSDSSSSLSGLSLCYRPSCSSRLDGDAWDFVSFGTNYFSLVINSTEASSYSRRSNFSDLKTLQVNCFPYFALPPRF